MAYGWARYNLNEGDVVVTTEMEHHANIVPWQELSKERGIELRYVPVDTEKFTLDYDAMEVAIEGASLVCVGHVSNVLGVRNDIERVIKMAHSRELEWLLTVLRELHVRKSSSTIWVLTSYQ